MPGYYQAASLLAGVALSCLVNAASISPSSLNAPDQVPVAAASPATVDRIDPARIAEAYGKLPLSFEANQGQTDPSVKFFSRGPGYRLFLTPGEVVLNLTRPSSVATDQREAVQQATLRMRFVGANPSPLIAGQSQLPAKSHYLIGDNAAKHLTDVPHYAEVRYNRMYPGIDVVFYGNPRNLEYDVLLSPGADLSAVKLKIEGADAVTLNAAGELVLRTPIGEMTQHRPIAYQRSAAGERAPIDARYVVLATNEVGFQLGDYDRTRPVVIDPVLTYSTFFASSKGEGVRALAVDSAGNVYVTGSTNSADFPLVNQYDRSLENGGSDAFVSKLNASGTALVYSTYLGGRYGNEVGIGIAVDSAGNAYVAGYGLGADFPVTTGAVRMTGGTGFVTKLNPQGKSLVYSALVAAIPKGVAVDSSGNAYITGFGQDGFVTTTGAYRQNKPSTISASDAIVTKLNATGTALVYSTYLGGSQGSDGKGVAVDANGNAYVMGQTGSSDFPTVNPLESAPPAGILTTFVTKLDASGSSLVYSTYLGGVNGAYGIGIAVDGNGFAHVIGKADAGFPLRNAFQPVFAGNGDAFVAKLNQAGNDLVYATYLGGAGEEIGSAVAVDAEGNAYVAGVTYANDFPLVNPLQTSKKNLAGAGTGFVAKFSQTGVLLYSTYLGGSGGRYWGEGDRFDAIAVDDNGNAYLGGGTTSTDFPVTAGAFKTSFGSAISQGIIAKISMASIAVTLASSASTIEPGQTVTLTATAVPKSGSGILAGTIAFIDGQTALATVPLANGSASVAVTLPVGVRTLTAVYSGSNDAAASPPLYLVVNPPSVCNE